jgi:hypothetical protein
MLVRAPLVLSNIYEPSITNETSVPGAAADRSEHDVFTLPDRAHAEPNLSSCASSIVFRCAPPSS